MHLTNYYIANLSESGISDMENGAREAMTTVTVTKQTKEKKHNDKTRIANYQLHHN